MVLISLWETSVKALLVSGVTREHIFDGEEQRPRQQAFPGVQ